MQWFGDKISSWLFLKILLQRILASTLIHNTSLATAHKNLTTLGLFLYCLVSMGFDIKDWRRKQLTFFSPSWGSVLWTRTSSRAEPTIVDNNFCNASKPHRGSFFHCVFTVCLQGYCPYAATSNKSFISAWKSKHQCRAERKQIIFCV